MSVNRRGFLASLAATRVAAALTKGIKPSGGADKSPAVDGHQNTHPPSPFDSMETIQFMFTEPGETAPVLIRKPGVITGIITPDYCFGLLAERGSERFEVYCGIYVEPGDALYAGWKPSTRPPRRAVHTVSVRICSDLEVAAELLRKPLIKLAINC